MIIQLDHSTDPRFILVRELPERVTFDELADWKYGPLLVFNPYPDEPAVLYVQPDGPGTDWVKDANA